MDWIINIITFILVVLGLCLLPFISTAAIFFLYLRFVKKIPMPPKKIVKQVKKRGFLRRIFFDFPRRFVLDLMTRDPNEFGMYGYHLFVGEQGSGKTVATVEFLKRIKNEYPLCKIATNFEYAEEDSKINSWHDLVFNNNGVYGQVDVIDEIQNWFSCNQSKDFPPEMIQEITQQRKQRKIMIGTTQRFERMAKPLREQCNFIYYPTTIAGCLTIVKVCKPVIDPDGQIVKLQTLRRYFFVHSDEIRNSFDTYHKIKKQAEDGFNLDNRDSSVVFKAEFSETQKKRKK